MKQARTFNFASPEGTGSVFFRLGPGLLVVVVLAWASLAAQTTVRYNYDQAGRLIRVQYGNRATILYGYDAAGNLLSRQITVGAVGLYFPFFQAQGNTFVGFAVSNYSDQEANLVFTAYGAAGETLAFGENPASRSLPAGTQLARLGTQIFSVDAATPRAGWVELSTNNPQIGSFFQFGNDDLTQLDGSVAFDRQAKTLYLTRAYEGATAFRGVAAATSLSIANPNPDPMTLNLELFGAQAGATLAPGAVSLAATTVTVPGKGFFYRSISDLFEQASVAGGYVKIEVTEGEGAVAFELIELPTHTTLIGLNAALETTSSESYSAQLADGNTIFTSLNLINTSSQTREATITAVGEDGENLADPVTVSLEPGEQLERDVLELLGVSTAAPAATLPAQGGTLQGSIRVVADGPGVIGDVIFGDPVGFAFAASMPLQTRKFTRAVFSQVANLLQFFTGMAFYNPNTVTAEVTIQVFSEEGMKTGEETISLEGGHRISKLVSHFVPSTEDQVRGYILVQSTQPIIAQQIFGESSLKMFSAVPPTIVQ